MSFFETSALIVELDNAGAVVPLFCDLRPIILNRLRRFFLGVNHPDLIAVVLHPGPVYWCGDSLAHPIRMRAAVACGRYFVLILPGPFLCELHGAVRPPR